MFVILSDFIILINLTRNVEKALSNYKKPSICLVCSISLGMNFAECCINKLELRICTNYKNIQYKVYETLGKTVNVYYQRLLTFFTINAFIKVYYF